MNREEVVNNIGYKMTKAAMEYYRENCANDVDLSDAFEEGAEWMLEQFEEWLRKTNKGQLIGSLNRFLEGNTSYRI